MHGVLRWIRAHDESWLFVAIYIGFAVVLSVWLSLFWLVLMVGIHFAFELVRQSRSFPRWPAVISMASWEVRVDVALLLLAFAVSLYMDLIMAILGLQSLGRAAVATSRVGARAVAWQRAVRAVVLGFDDVANAIRAVFMRKGAAAEPASAAQDAPSEPEARNEPAPDPDPALDRRSRVLPGWGDRWGFWDRFTLALCGACVAAMIVAPPLTDSTYGEAIQTLREELRPIPQDEEDSGQAPTLPASGTDPTH